MWAVQDLDAYDDAADDQDDEGVIDAADSWTVTDLMGQIRAYIGDMFPDEIWVTGEVANLNRSARGHVYFSLIDPDGDPKKPIALKVTLFDWYRKPVNHILTRAHGQIRMDNGVQIRVRGSVELYAARGEISLRMTSIDPNFTLGLIEAERNALLRRLAESGQLRANGLLPRPQLPLRIALITSRGSAAEADFCEELARYGYGFRVTLIDARVQGAESVDSIVSAFDTAQALDVDVVALVRGGGAKTDLASFDAEPVALAIATCSKPVFSGIGHEIDTSVADAVSHTSLKTPTAVAQHIVGIVAEAEMVQERTLESIERAAVRSIDANTRSIQTMMRQLDAAVSARHATMSHQLDLFTAHLAHRSGLGAARQLIGDYTAKLQKVSTLLDNRERDLDRAAVSAQLRDPALLAERGFTIARRRDGTLIKRASELSAGDGIDISFADGTASATVDTITASTNKQSTHQKATST